MVSRLDSCRCYVKRLPDHFQMQLRWGAHALDCPAYHRSADIVDDAQDCEVRAKLLEREMGVRR